MRKTKTAEIAELKHHLQEAMSAVLVLSEAVVSYKKTVANWESVAKTWEANEAKANELRERVSSIEAVQGARSLHRGEFLVTVDQLAGVRLVEARWLGATGVWHHRELSVRDGDPTNADGAAAWVRECFLRMPLPVQVPAEAGT